jgi:hypothetical protein
VVVDPALIHRKTWLYATSAAASAPMSPLDLLGSIRSISYRAREPMATNWRPLSPALAPETR